LQNDKNQRSLKVTDMKFALEGIEQ